MESLVDFALQERYKQVKDLGDRLGELSILIEWEPFREIVGEIYTNTTEQGGRPNIDVVLMIKLLVLQSNNGLSDPELERQANDKISFLKFLGFPEKIPDHTTVWYFRERLSKTKFVPGRMNESGGSFEERWMNISMNLDTTDELWLKPNSQS